VSPSLHHAIALTENGKVLAWGRGDTGQLGIVDATTGGAVQESYECVATALLLMAPPPLLRYLAPHAHVFLKRAQLARVSLLAGT
jgi:alpha-tubulin suppressor-like RCC1 family protein